jgi:hypothetical protein
MAAGFIRGVLRDEATGTPARRVTVEAWDTGGVVGRPIGATTTDEAGAFEIPVSDELRKRLVAQRLEVYVLARRDDQVVADSRGTALWDPREPQPLKILVRPGRERGDTGYEVRGRIVTERGTGAEGVRVVAADRLLRGENVLGSDVTDGDGRYVIRYGPKELGRKALADVEVRVTGSERPDGAELARSKIFYQAPASLVVDLFVPYDAVPRRSEHERLLQSLEPLVGDVPLAEVDADGVRLLANRTGWDPRMVAMVVQSARASAESGIPAPHYYALFRSGAAADPTAVHQLPEEQLVQALRAAEAGGIVADDLPIERTVEAHRIAARTALRSFVPSGGVSSLGELLGLRLDDVQKDVFVDRLRETAGREDELWESLVEAGMDREVVERLQTDGKLGHLTRHNAPVMRRLIETERVEATTDLVTAGLYDAAAWEPIVAGDVPGGLTKEAYTKGLAAQVRQAHPTLVMADLVRKEAIDVGGPQVATAVADFYASAEGKTRIGATPIRTWDGFAGLAPDAQQGALLVERLHQISPSDESMRALSKLGIDSARSVARTGERPFLATHGGEFPSLTEARLTHRKAQEVHGTALNLATAYLTWRGRPDLSAVGNAAPLGDDVPAKATLETLFHNLDLCACEHCQSVLSPAAYFVELLELLDLSDVAHDKANPIEVLLERRPDLQHLALTCENTNVALPYIDIVNEVLEHYIANGTLDDFTGHDTAPGVASADLLVEPQFVEEAAYTALAGAVFPAPLPFDMPLEALRLYFQSWGTTLARALEHFGTPAEVRRERLGLNAAEWSMLTDQAFRSLPEYFGEAPGQSIDDLNAAIANAKVFSRRVDVAYVELARILETRFVNPGVLLTDTFKTLHVGLDVVESWFDGDLTDQQLLDQLPDDLDTEPFGGDVLAWLTTNRQLLMGLVVLAPVAGADQDLDECDFGALELRLSIPGPAASALTELEYHRLHRFVRLWRTLDRVLDADIALVDELLVAFLPLPPAELTMLNLDGAMATAISRIATFVRVLDESKVAKKSRATWLDLFDDSLDATARVAQLAKFAKLGETDFANLVAITGIDPFADDLETDAPSILRFLRVVRHLKAASLKVDDIDFLLRDGDATGTHVPTPTQIRTDLLVLRAAHATVDATLGSGAGVDFAAAQSRMSLLYDPAVVAQFFGLLSGTTTYRAPLATVEEVLPAPVTAVTPSIGFDAFADELTFTGSMSQDVHDTLHAAADALTLGDVDVIDAQPALDAFIADLKTSVTALRTGAQDDLAALHAEHPALGDVFEDAAAAAGMEAQATVVLDALLGELRAVLKTTALRIALANLLRADETIVGALTAGSSVLHADGDPAAGVLDDLLALDQTVAFDQDAAFELDVDPPATDDYLFYVQAPPGTQVALRVDGADVVAAAPVGPGGEVASVDSVALKASVPARFELTLAGLPAGDEARLLWRTQTMPKAPVPASRSIAVPQGDRAAASLLRLRKAVALAGGLALTPREITFAAASAPDTKGILDDLPVGGPPQPADVPPLWAKLEPLVWFTAWKQRTEPDTDTWVEMLETSALGDAAGQARVAAVGAWRTDDITEAMTFLGAAGDDLQRFTTVRAVAELADLAVETGQTVANLRAWAVAGPDAALLGEIRDEIKSVVDAAAWRESMRSVNDVLRNLRRDALVAYILVHLPPTPAVETADELYEHFLVDVEMDACMQTSRIRSALSTVQLYVTRCLMNLEDEVAAGSIRQDEWAWMKRYRVWEANRKIFLWPENWLEPELRDGKSPFFRELESDLLKSDINNDLAEDAFLAYLKKLDEVARLEIVAAYLQQGTTGKEDDNILHVVGRTNGKTRQHWYRRFEYGYWTPWEKVTLDIEGDLVLLTMWRGQLFLFWATTVEKPRPGTQDSSSAQFASQTWRPRSPIDVEITLSWGELYRGKWVSPKSTNMRDPIVIPSLRVFHPGALLLFSRAEKPEGLSERLWMTVVYYVEGDVKAYLLLFTSKNAPPVMFEDQNDPTVVQNVARFYEELFWERQSDADLDANGLDVPRADVTLRIEQPPNAWAPTVDETLLTKASGIQGWSVRTVMHPVENQWEAPFFFADEHATFHVQPDERHTSFIDIDWYVPLTPMEPEVVFNIPPLYEEVVVPNPRDPIWNPQWRELVSPTITKVLGHGKAFDLDGTTFGIQGLVG